MKIILYSTGCPNCIILANSLKSKNIKYEVCSDKSKMIELGFTKVPMLQVGEEIFDMKKSMEWVNNYNANK